MFSFLDKHFHSENTKSLLPSPPPRVIFFISPCNSSIHNGETQDTTLITHR